MRIAKTPVRTRASAQVHTHTHYAYTHRLAEQLEMLRTNEHAALDASAHNDKFATSPDVFEAAFGKLDEFLEGVAG